MPPAASHTDRLLRHLARHPLSRSRDLVALGITPATISRAVAVGQVERVARGLYQLPGTNLGTFTTEVEASVRVPRGTLCLVSALTLHGLTDQLPAETWLAVGPSEHVPRIEHPPVRVVRFREPYLSWGREERDIEGIAVPVYSVAKTVADLWRTRHTPLPTRIEGLRRALEERRASPAEIVRAAEANGAMNRMRPYFEALTADA